MKMKSINSVLIFLLFQSQAFCQLKNVKSIIEIYDVTTEQRMIVDTENNHLEAPNWSRDGRYLIYNSNGKLIKLNIKTKEKISLNTDFANKINNDHGISPDGNQIVISNSDQPDAAYKNHDWRKSKIYTIPYSGGIPKLITKNEPSFWHGWSPDGKTLAFVGQRDNNYDIYIINSKGGSEIRLTYENGLDDGPDYSYDGKFIYYNSVQSGKMEIWRMDADGDNKLQITEDEYSNWFPHPSPNGDVIVFLSYLEDQGFVHPPMKNVALRLYNIQDGTIKTLFKFIGGQGTINVPSWSPDGNRFAFVSYEYLVKKE